jgi:hypothetical protein
MLTLIAQQAQFGDTGIEPLNETFGENVTVQGGIGAVKSVELIVSRSLGFLTVLAGLFFIIYFFLGAFKWLTAGGDSGKVQKARDEMVQGVLGLIIIVAAYGIIGIVGSVLGLDLLNPGREIIRIFTP